VLELLVLVLASVTAAAAAAAAANEVVALEVPAAILGDLIAKGRVENQPSNKYSTRKERKATPPLFQYIRCSYLLEITFQPVNMMIEITSYSLEDVIPDCVESDTRVEYASVVVHGERIRSRLCLYVMKGRAYLAALVMPSLGCSRIERCHPMRPVLLACLSGASGSRAEQKDRVHRSECGQDTTQLR
jgi:hypothetical protein